MIVYAVIAPIVTACVVAALLGTTSALEAKVLTKPVEAEHRRR